MIQIERNLRKLVSAAVKSAAKAEKQLKQARERRDDLTRQTRNAQRRAANAQTAKTQKEYTRLLSQLEKARGVVKSRATVATEQRRAQKAAERRLEIFERADSNPYTGERYTHIFQSTPIAKLDYIADIAKIYPQFPNLSYTQQREIMREMKQRISRRIRSLKDVQKQYGDSVPDSDAVTEYEESIKRLSPSNPENYDTIAIFADKLFNKNEFEAGTMTAYRGLIEGVSEIESQLKADGVTDDKTKDFYRVLNLIRKYFPLYEDDSETKKQIKLRLDSGMSVSEVFNELSSWFGTEQMKQDKDRSKENIARRQQMREQAREAREKQKERIAREQREKRGV